MQRNDMIDEYFGKSLLYHMIEYIMKQIIMMKILIQIEDDNTDLPKK
jgi:hypothetical protein